MELYRGDEGRYQQGVATVDERLMRCRWCGVSSATHQTMLLSASKLHPVTMDMLEL